MEVMFAKISSNEAIIRLCVFVGVSLLMLIWEFISPRRILKFSRLFRWSHNLGIAFLNTALLRVILPMSAIGFALLGYEQGWGLFNFTNLPIIVEVILSILLLDVAIYFQHRLFHWVPALWRLHRMHHADQDYDFTTGSRFHPLEIMLSMLIKFGVIAVLGAPAIAVILFEVILNASSMFNHGNVRIAPGVDAILRWIIVTPDMHRVHHSVSPVETNSNFGFNLPWWDRLFATYRAQPEKGHQGMTIGINQFREPLDQRIDQMLLQPFANKK